MEEAVPPYPDIPHFPCPPEERNRQNYQQDTYKLFELAALVFVLNLSLAGI
ncbi:MAG: hypothetical protein QXI71_00510 [Candidatus Bathyarchaeia archaeon]